MSIETWKAEFYPVPANEVPESEAVAHSLQKWIGLRFENLARHGMVNCDAGYQIKDRSGSSLKINAGSCALCVHFFRDDDAEGCVSCPLREALGMDCDSYDEDSPERTGPYQIWSTTVNPEPMIEALKKAAAQ